MVILRSDISNSQPSINQAEIIAAVANHEMYYIIKRIIDLIGSVLALLLLTPMIGVIALLIASDSPGPIIFRQTRIGSRKVKNDNSALWKRADFVCYKFRTMQSNVSEDIHKTYITALITNDQNMMKDMEGDLVNMHKLVNDNRITKIGKFLRKYSLDEIPQFWNVIRGEMSLVGPRPPIPYEFEMYSPWHLRRMEAKPGITGLQQTTARCTASFDEQVRLDIQYIEKQSIWLDIRIILKTAITVFTQLGA